MSGLDENVIMWEHTTTAPPSACTSARVKRKIEYINTLSTKDRRFIYSKIREDESPMSLFFPSLGVDAATFAIGHIVFPK